MPIGRYVSRYRRRSNTMATHLAPTGDSRNLWLRGTARYLYTPIPTLVKPRKYSATLEAGRYAVNSRLPSTVFGRRSY